MDEVELYNFGKNLRRIRKEKGYTQEDLAKVVDLNRSAFSSFENNKREPTYTTLVKLADFLEVEIKDLLGSETNDATSFMTDEEFADYYGWSEGLKDDIYNICNQLNQRGLFALLAAAQGIKNVNYFSLEESEFDPSDEIFEQNNQTLAEEYDQAFSLFIQIENLPDNKMSHQRFNDYLEKYHYSPSDYYKKFK